jgi:hypothetical protein
LMLLLSVIKPPTQTPTWTITTRCNESIKHLHYRQRYTFHYRYVVCAIMSNLFKCQFSWFVSWSRFLFTLCEFCNLRACKTQQVQVWINFSQKMNKLFQLIPIPFTPNILSLSSAGEKFTLLITVMFLKFIGRSVQKF